MKSSLYGAGAEYALHSLLILATRPGPVSVGDLASFQKLPERFLAKLFTRLKKAVLVKSTEGVKGGYVLARPPEEVRVMATTGSHDRDTKLLVRVGPTIMVDADPHHIVSALSNLVQNAMKCTKPGTTVRLSAQDSGAQVKIEVEDECGGLPPGQACWPGDCCC